MNTSARPSPTTKQKLDAFEEGRRAGQEGLGPESNPYRESPELARKWEQGLGAGVADAKAKLHQHGHGSR